MYDYGYILYIVYIVYIKNDMVNLNINNIFCRSLAN